MTRTLDYTCGAFSFAIWGKSIFSSGIVAIMWPIMAIGEFQRIINVLIIFQLQFCLLQGLFQGEYFGNSASSLKR